MIGQRIRVRRNELGLSLRELAEQVDLTASFLSQIERDQADPSIRSLRRIADALGVPIFYFLSEADAPDPVVRQAGRKRLTLPDSRTMLEFLTPDLERKIEMFVATVRQPSDQNFANPLPHPTEECILVLAGRLRVVLDENEYILETGDSIYFEGSRLRGMYALGDGPVEFISAMTPPAY